MQPQLEGTLKEIHKYIAKNHNPTIMQKKPMFSKIPMPIGQIRKREKKKESLID